MLDIDCIELDQFHNVCAVVECKFFGERFGDKQKKSLMSIADNQFKKPVPFFVLWHNEDMSKVKVTAMNNVAKLYGSATNEEEWVKILYRVRHLEIPSGDKAKNEATYRQEMQKNIKQWYDKKLCTEMQIKLKGVKQ